MPVPPGEPIETFEAVVEAIENDALCLRTRASGGEESMAWLPRSAVPMDERALLRLGARLRVTIHAGTPPTSTVRVLPVAENTNAAADAEALLATMERVLQRGS